MVERARCEVVFVLEDAEQQMLGIIELVSLVDIAKLGNSQLVSDYLHQFRGTVAGKKFNV